MRPKRSSIFTWVALVIWFGLWVMGNFPRTLSVDAFGVQARLGNEPVSIAAMTGWLFAY